MTTATEILTTATAIYDPDLAKYARANIVVNAHPAGVAKALYALGIDGNPVFADGTGGAVNPATRVVVQIDAILADVAQAAAEGIARAIGHVLPTVIT
jgi:hypothetical protein